MNVFLTDPDPKVCAIVLDDKRVNKMALETAQLLCTSLRLQGVESDALYKSTHTAHPCSKWAARSRGNFNWLVEHGLELCEEYEFRTDRRRQHASKAVIEQCYHLRHHVPDLPLVLGPVDLGGFNSSGFDAGDVFQSYKLSMVNKWRNIDGFKTKRSRKPVWTYRGAPLWKRDLWATDFSKL